MAKITMTVNGRQVSGQCDDRTLLVHFIRENLGLTGTHVGCDTSQCGACVVHMDGNVGQELFHPRCAGGGLDRSPPSKAWPPMASCTRCRPPSRTNHGLQCGFCTPGMVMTAVDMIRRHGGQLDEATVRAELDGNICRCTGYHNIVKAILAAAAEMGGARVAAE